MKKLFFASLIVAALVAVLVSTSSVFAQSPNPTAPAGSAYGYGRGMGGGLGIASGADEGILHDAMIAYFAKELGLTVDELNTRLAGGETIAQIATAKGYTADQVATLITNARSAALDQAVKDGKLTQAQADWMKQRGTAMNGSGTGIRGGMGGRGMRGAGAGNGACPYCNQTNP